MERLSLPANRLAVRGQLRIYSAPSALRRHIDWAIQESLGNWVKIEWSPQILMVGTYTCEVEWRDRAGVAGEIASALRSWHYLIFEVHEDSNDGGELFRFTPQLGMHRAVTDLAGAVVISENQIDNLLKSNCDEASIRKGFASILGRDWESELERFRGNIHRELSHLRAI